MLILAGSTDRRAREPATQYTIVCPICGTIFFERDVFKLHVSNYSPKKMTTGLHGDLFSSNAHLPEYSEEDDYITSPEVLAPRVIPMKIKAIIKRRKMKKYHI